MFTGNDLYLLVQQALGIAYTGQVTLPRAQRFCDRAFIQVCESVYNTNETQRTRDDLSFLVSTNQVFQIRNNQIYTVPLLLSNVTIVATTGTFTTVLPHNLATGDSVTISGIAGFTPNPNGTFTITVTGANTFTATVTSASGTYTANTGQLTYGAMISDYWHLLTLEAKYQKYIYDFSVSTITNATPCVVTLDHYNNISTGESITISNSFGNTAVNGTWYVKKLNELSFAIYSDKNFQTPVAGNGAYMGGAKLQRTWYNYAKPYISDVKIGELNIPTVADPKVEVADKYLKVYPLDETCLEITIDYVQKPLVPIDITNTVIDLEAYYPKIFLNQIASEMQVQFSAALRDPEAYQESMAQKNREGAQ